MFEEFLTEALQAQGINAVLVFGVAAADWTILNDLGLALARRLLSEYT